MKEVRLERIRDFGDVWLALGLWPLLGLDSMLSDVMTEGREEISWPIMAAILTIARFCEPSSELHIEDTWYRRTALEDLLGVTPGKVHTDRLYAALDQLLPHKELIEKHLKDGMPSGYEVFDGNTPDAAQKVLLDRLGLKLPQRLRRIDEVIQM